MDDERRLLIEKLADTMDPANAAAMVNGVLRAAFEAGFEAGFSITREGFNSECSFDHLAPFEFQRRQQADDPLVSMFTIAREAKWAAYFAAFVEALRRA